MDRPPARREIVFCHACENEWYREEHGLSCPDCHSDFTEIIEPDHDPRAAAPDPDEDDIDFVESQGAAPGQPPPPFGNLLQTAVGHLFGGGLPLGAQQQPGQPGERSQSMPPNRQTTGPGSGQPRVTVYTNSGPGFQFSAHTTTYSNFSSTRGQDPAGAMGADDSMGHDDLSRMLIDLVGTIQGQDHAHAHGGFHGTLRSDLFGRGPGDATGARRTAGGMMGGFLNQILGMHGDPGDYITNQEAFDRIMSQLMEQNQAGSAPGPAAESAISSIPKKPADAKILGGDKADCSICMLETNIGDTVAVLPCNHWYHPDCISMWLREHDTCAICRKGITPKEGESSTVRQPHEEPLHDHDPANVARRQTGHRDDPIWVPDSPASARRSRPETRRHSSAEQSSDRGSRPGTGEGVAGGAGSFTRSFRNMFSGSSGMSGQSPFGGGGGGGSSSGRNGRGGSGRQ